MKSLSHYRLVLAFILSSVGLAAADGSAFAQQALPKWTPTRESVIVSAVPTHNYRIVLSGSHLGGEAFIVSASMQVPYSDLDLARDPDATELGRRIQVAARLVCRQLDLKYPPALFPIVDGFNCEHDAASDGMSRANMVIASARK
jgi:UrcA family protein